ncbi:metalloendopeptidase OMA1, mitochondrial-like [Myzus persicae]|uniref:metalloendopeptidase OMA1, mitochondrial-like n=1 Tax=Myzus persicae TaxID=13164 RepID=UPI000B939A25|nr:metalloendopeptidase OMA1, mitochondrial-like [Myzus persicae]
MSMCKLWATLDYIAITTIAQLAIVFGIIFGLAARFWWTRNTVETRQQYSAMFWENILYIELAAACSLALFAAFLWKHTERDPWTGSRRLLLFSEQMLMKQAERETRDILKSTRPNQLDSTHPGYVRVAGVVSRLLAANSGVDAIQDHQWTVVVVNSQSVNAIVEPNGLVLVYSGLMSMANDDQLTILIGHEFAHCVLRHANQINSLRFAITALCLVPATPLIFALLPLGWNLLTHLCLSTAVTLFIVLPCIRSYETEADRIGMEMAAKTCVDVTQGHLFWSSMATTNKQHKLWWWLSMHPTYESRSRHLLNLIPAAMEIRRQAGC